MNIKTHNILGDINSDWHIYKFSEVAELIHGYQFRTNDFTKSGVKVFKITQIKEDGTIDLSACDFIERTRLEDFKKNVIQKGDILMALTGATIGKIARYNSDETVLQNYRVGNFISKSENVLSKDFLFYFLKSKLFFNQLLARQTQSAQQNIGKEDINNMSICFPDIERQKVIAEILCSIDDKIENNLSTNKLLEDLIKALFNEICIPKADSDDFASFKLQEFIDIKNGYAFKGMDFIDEGIPVIKIKNVKAGKVNLNNLSYVSSEIAEKAKRFRIKQNDLLITMSGNRIDGTPETWVGKVGIFHREGEYLLNQRVSILNILDEEIMSRYFLCQLLSSEEFQYYFISNATSSGGQANISPDLIYSTEIVVPPKEVMQKFHHLAKDIYSKIFANELEIETLANLRDTLLPKLMKGEINI